MSNYDPALIAELKRQGYVVVSLDDLKAVVEEGSCNDGAIDYDRFWEARENILPIIEAAESDDLNALIESTIDAEVAALSHPSERNAVVAREIENVLSLNSGDYRCEAAILLCGIQVGLRTALRQLQEPTLVKNV